jgi:hypothetical protein
MSGIFLPNGQMYTGGGNPFSSDVISRIVQEYMTKKKLLEQDATKLAIEVGRIWVSRLQANGIMANGIAVVPNLHSTILGTIGVVFAYDSKLEGWYPPQAGDEERLRSFTPERIQLVRAVITNAQQYGDELLRQYGIKVSFTMDDTSQMACGGDSSGVSITNI